MAFFDAGHLAGWRRRRREAPPHIAGDYAEIERPDAAPMGNGARLRRRVVDHAYGLGLGIGLVAATTGALLILVPTLNQPRITIAYLVPILISATWCGMAAAVTAAITSVLALAFFFYPPDYDIRVADPEQVIDLIVFLAVALLTSHLASELRNHAATARQREREIAALYALSRRLAICHSASDIYGSIQDHLSFITGRRVALFGIKGAQQGQPEVSAQAWVPEQVRQAAAGISSQAPRAGGTEITDKETGHTWVLRLLSPDMPDFGVAAIDLGKDSSGAGAAVEHRIDAALTDVAATLRRLDVDRAINEAKVRSEAELLREALIGSVSHELRAPLASILGAATVLLQAQTVANDAHLGPLAKVVRDEAERLNGEIQDLLDAARISQGVRPRSESTDPIDVVNAAVERRRPRLSAHRVEIDLARDLPFVEIDPILIEQALGQILENAAKYSPSGSTIKVTARAEQEQVTISVQDEGAGLTEQEQNHLWRRFFRGQRHVSTVSGSGVGLWIAQAFVNANGGTLEAASQGEGRGTTIAMRLPAAREDLHGADE